jgi:AraC family transcriptional regulator
VNLNGVGMTTSESYVRGLAQRLHLEAAPVIVTRALSTAEMAVTDTRCMLPVKEMSGSLPREDAFFVTLSLHGFPGREYWEDGRLVSVCDIRAGQTCIHDLKRDPVARLDKPHHVMFFYLPRSALDAIADDANAPRIGDLNYEPVGMDDPTVAGFGDVMMPALHHPDQANQLFIDHVFLGFGIHVAQTYGGMRALPQQIRGGLAPWQERRAKEILSASIDGRVMLKDVARECGLSASHFSRAFHRTIGTAPHHWLLKRRVTVAKEKLRDRRLTLSEVALACGFSDQSHLTRIFTRFVGVSPGAWRRALLD